MVTVTCELCDGQFEVQCNDEAPFENVGWYHESCLLQWSKRAKELEA